MLFNDQRGWITSLTRKIKNTNKKYFFYEIALFSTNQVVLFLSFILPLKALIVLSTKTVPTILQQAYPQLTWFSLALALMLGAAFGYALSLFFESSLEKTYQKHANIIKARANKLNLPGNNISFFIETLRKVTRIYSSKVLLVIFTSLFFLINDTPLLPSAFTLLLFLFVFTVIYLPQKAHGKSSSTKLVTTTSNIFFFFSIFFLFFYLYYINIGPFTAIINILLLRQSFQRTSVLVLDYRFLLDNNIKIKSSFFTAIPYEKIEDDNSEISDCRNSLVNLFTDYYSTTEILLKWNDSCAINIPLYSVIVNGVTTGFVRVYDPSVESVLEKETLLYQEMGDSRLVPRLADKFLVDDLTVLFFSHPEIKRVSNRKFEKLSSAIKSNLQLLTPTDKLIQLQNRSTKLYFQSIKVAAFDKLRFAINTPSEKVIFEEFMKKSPEIINFISDLPFFIYNPEITADNYLTSDEGDILASWSGWQILPVGATLNLQEDDLEELKGLISKKTSDVSTELLMLSSLIWKVQHLISRNRLAVALGLLKDILMYAKVVSKNKS